MRPTSTIQASDPADFGDTLPVRGALSDPVDFYDTSPDAPLPLDTGALLQDSPSADLFHPHTILILAPIFFTGWKAFHRAGAVRLTQADIVAPEGLGIAETVQEETKVEDELLAKASVTQETGEQAPAILAAAEEHRRRYERKTTWCQSLVYNDRLRHFGKSQGAKASRSCLP
ncbi:unnamed protein product [Zymoseptoria tritici ST99CH_1A5]|uniref:Uncharacterized protein n=1 Tax=Zymoseptoria tritici ST99CH_1A5 TaxID=1276529 RepID=A0A1Y6M108_ZYMTR|nr:unnamed protein product [Zymoseptoria tritici ST99CH_1A5]